MPGHQMIQTRKFWRAFVRGGLRKFIPWAFLGLLVAVSRPEKVEGIVIPVPEAGLDYQSVSIRRQVTIVSIRKNKTATIRTLIVPSIAENRTGEVIFAIPGYSEITNLTVQEAMDSDFANEITALEGFINERTSWPARFQGRLVNRAFTIGLGRDDLEVPTAEAGNESLASTVRAACVRTPAQLETAGFSIREIKEKDDLRALLLRSSIPDEMRFRLRLYADSQVVTVKLGLSEQREPEAIRGFVVQYETEPALTDRGFRIQLPFSVQRTLPGVVELTGIYIETPRRMVLELVLPDEGNAKPGEAGNPRISKIASPNRAITRVVYAAKNLSSDVMITVRDTEQDVWWDLGETVSHWQFNNSGYWFGGLYAFSCLISLKWFLPRGTDTRRPFQRRLTTFIRRLTLVSLGMYAVLAGVTGLVLWQLV